MGNPVHRDIGIMLENVFIRKVKFKIKSDCKCNFKLYPSLKHDHDRFITALSIAEKYDLYISIFKILKK